jgi:chromosome segregation ATPase
MRNTKTFEVWLSENDATAIQISDAPQSAQTNIETSKNSNISIDVDTIINSLETLAGELTEELNNIDLEEVFEATSKADPVIDFMFRAPKARKAQKKVNSMNLKVADIEAASSAMSGEKKTKVADKVKILKTQASDLQKAVEDKFSSSSDIVKRALASEKIKGKLEVIKSAMGDDSNSKSDLKTQAKKLQQRLKDEESAMAEDEPDKAEIDKVRKEQKVAAAAKANENEDSPKNSNEAIKESDKDGEKKNSKELMIDRYTDLLQKEQNESADNKIKEFKDKIDSISQKESWQIEGTELGRILESELSTYEMSSKLNESAYEALSIKDKFSRLL